jgi:hypothetical protein
LLQTRFRGGNVEKHKRFGRALFNQGFDAGQQARHGQSVTY